MGTRGQNSKSMKFSEICSLVESLLSEAVHGLPQNVDEFIQKYGYPWYDSFHEEADEKERIEYYKKHLVYWINKYNNLPDPVVLYRMITLNDISELDVTNIGIFWTDQEDKAKVYWGEGTGKKYILKALVNSSAIDWKGTLYYNMHPEIGMDEQEILLKESEIELLAYKEVGGEWIDKKMKVKAVGRYWHP